MALTAALPPLLESQGESEEQGGSGHFHLGLLYIRVSLPEMLRRDKICHIERLWVRITYFD